MIGEPKKYCQMCGGDGEIILEVKYGEFCYACPCLQLFTEDWDSLIEMAENGMLEDEESHDEE